MCGIVGIIGTKPVADAIVEALRRLEYRGYDSAGVSTLENGRLTRARAEGKLRNLEARLSEVQLGGHTGIGHTRWATHGAPTEQNAHPHMTSKVAVVHNGIIENFQELKDDLVAYGAVFSSETDTEIIAHLITRYIEEGATPIDAARRCLKELSGAFALAILIEGQENLMIVARQGSPLAIGYGDGETFVGSDAIALAPFTNTITYLEDGDWAVLTRDGAEIRDLEDRIVNRPVQKTIATTLLVDKGNHRHFMAKEIHEQPEVVSHTLSSFADIAEARIVLPDLPVEVENLDRLTISACGTAYYAGLIAKYWFETYAGLGVEIDIASEFRYRNVPLKSGGLSLFISQSGETADTLAALRHCKASGQKTVSVVNVPQSTMARESDAILQTLAGPEIGVASTKAFTCQLVTLACLAIGLGVKKGLIDRDRERELVSALISVPRHMSHVLQMEDQFEEICHILSKARDVLYLGRGTAFPIALEGALKLKEISYIHAEGYAAGELKHGPIALIDENVPIVVVAPGDELYEKTHSNMQEVAARGGQIILLTDQDMEQNGLELAAKITLPPTHPLVHPLIFALPVQILAYHTAVFMGTDVDQPRNLAKSVTVE